MRRDGLSGDQGEENRIERVAVTGLDQGGETHALGVRLSNIHQALLQAGVTMAGGAGGTGSPPTPGRAQTGLNVSSPHPSSTSHLLFFDTEE